jgi:hypothetical protein
MAYNWAQLAFVEKWRLNAVRGPVVGMYRPDDRTFFDLRLHPGEGGVGQIPGPTDLHLVDAGNLVREKRVVLMDRLAVVVRVVATLRSATGPSVPSPESGRSRRRLEPGSRIAGKVVQVEADVALVHVGFPVIVALPEGAEGSLRPDQAVELSLSETPKGFIVL